MRSGLVAAAAAAMAAAWAPSGAAAGGGPAPETVDLLRDAEARGYGDTCDLAGRHADRNGYFRCLDVGPYRFSFGDRTIHGYVVMRDADPFPFMEEGEDGAGGYTVGGPWERDLDANVAGWYADEVQGGRARREASRADAERARDAGAAVEAYGGRGGAAQAGPSQGGQVPQAQPYAGYRQYPPQGYPPQGYPTQGYPAQGYGAQQVPERQPAYGYGREVPFRDAHAPPAPAPDSSPLAMPQGPATNPPPPGATR